MRQFYRRIALAKERLGGKCEECGATEDLEFDHVDPLRKRADVMSLWSYSLERFLDEVDACQLLCHSCHAEKTAIEKRMGLHRLRVRDRQNAQDPVPF